MSTSTSTEKGLGPIAAVLVASAIVGGATAGFVLHLLRDPVPTSARPVELPARDLDLTPLIERLDRMLERTSMEPPATVESAPRIDAARAPTLDLEPLQELLDRVEAMERRLAKTSLDRSHTALSGLEYTQPTRWNIFESYFDPADPEGARTRLLDRFRMATIHDVMRALGRPTTISSNDRGLRVYYKREPLWIRFDVHHGFVISVSMDHE